MSGNGNVILKVLKVAGWTLLSVVVVVTIFFWGAVKFLESKELSSYAERIANEYIDGHVKIGSLKIGFHPGFPILGIDLKDLSIISHAFNSLTDKERGILPSYADSLLTLGRMSGSLDIKRLIINNELSLHDVELQGLSVNLVISHNGKANYEVVKIPENTIKSQKEKIPGFRINRFALNQPKEIRFYNASDSTSASVLLLTDAAVDGHNMPIYRLKINGNVTSPKATLLTNLEKINFGMNGTVNWNPDNPGLVAIDNMEIQGAFLKAIVGGEIDLKDSPIVRKGTVEIEPLAIADILSLLPDSIRYIHHLYEPYFSTNAMIGGRFELTNPMNLATDTIPSAQIQITVPSSHIHYGGSNLKNLTMEVKVNTQTNLPDKTVVDLRKFTVDGPGTSLQISALVSTPISDPTFETDVKGKIDFKDLPPIILEKIPGYLAGVISADVHAKGRVSMFKPQHLHQLAANGEVSAQNIYFLSADTSKMVQVGKAKIDIESDRIVDNLPLLKTKLAVDTATILVSGVDLALGAISLSAGIEKPGNNKSGFVDSTLMIPISGNLKVRQFNITSITDSAGARIRNIGGNIRIQELKGNSNIPQISADLLIGNVSAGTLSDRVLLKETKVKASLLKMWKKTEAKKNIDKKKRPHSQYAYIAPANVYKYVYFKRTHRKHTRRVYGEVGTDDEELLVWNLTPQFRSFLNDWKLNGSVNTTDAHLLTPFFPLRNRISSVALRFNNDTINISNISLRAGRSDISVSGLITNVRRAMTSKTNNDLKGNLSLFSDTIDINELSASVFTGASYLSDKKHRNILKIKTYDDTTLQTKLDELSKKGPGRSDPVLIPVNVNANLRINAKHLLYSDLDMQNMRGDILVYDGGVNLHNITANSDAGNLTISALYSAPKAENMHIGFGLEAKDFNIAKFVKLVPAIDSITPLMHDFSGMIGADVAATCSIDSSMNLVLPSLNAAIRINGDNLAFIDPEKYRTLGKWLGFKNKADNTIHSLNVEMTVTDGLMRVYPFAFNIDRYRLGVYGSNNIAMDFDYHLAVLKSPIPFKFGITISGSPKKYKVRFGGARFNEDTVIESVNIVNNTRINLMDQIEEVFIRGVRNSRFAKLNAPRPVDFEKFTDPGLSAADSLQLMKEGLIESPTAPIPIDKSETRKKKKRKKFLFF